MGEHSGKMATETVRLRIAGMGRDGCVAAVQEALGKVEGVRRVAVDLTTGTAEVDLEPPADPTVLVTAVDGAGYDAGLA